MLLKKGKNHSSTLALHQPARSYERGAAPPPISRGTALWSGPTIHTHTGEESFVSPGGAYSTGST